MTVRSDSSLVTIPLQGLPVAAAMLDSDGVIVAANRRFTRLCGRADGLRLADVVAEQDRATVDEALSGLML
ncbi:PAS domain-containing protein, partial [Salmonella sp. SAL4435]|uniref:PAS domain-containing protein n=1 Tax=Salmonella sp. SAL4435 TaxID=3159890 RepID=UPI00397AD786